MQNIFLACISNNFFTSDIAAFLFTLLGMFFLSLAMLNKKQSAFISLFFITYFILFASRIIYQGANFYPLLLFIFAVIFIVLEIFIPGFTITGLLGLIGYFTSVVLTFNDYKYGILAIFISIIINLIFIRLMFKNGYTFKGLTHFVLTAESNLKENKKDNEELEILLDKEAKSISTLGPTGYVLIDGKKYNAISYNGYLDRDISLKVIGVKGRYLIVDKEVK